MKRTWGERWTVTGKGKSGGQGRSSHVEDATGAVGYLKELNKPGDRRARARFRREVGSYETLAGHPSLPRLLDHNADCWNDRDTALFLVLEFIDGGTVGDRVRTGGSIDLPTALKMIGRLCDVVEYCHQNDVVHRDLKPENILLRGGNADDPVIIDFGLAFNVILGESELTRLNEEVGNRFLRLPEHSTGGRNPASDVAQLVGLLFYVLTGHEPRLLQDGEERMPHQRQAGRSVLDSLEVSASQSRRLLAVFDCGFRQNTASRFQTAADLREALKAIMSEDPSEPSIEDLLRSLDDDVPAEDRRRVASAAQVIRSFRNDLYNAIEQVAQSKSLHVSWGAGPDQFESDPPTGVTRYALTIPGVIPSSSPEWAIELVGNDEIVVVQHGVQIWRGSDPTDPELLQSVFATMVEDFKAGPRS